MVAGLLTKVEDYRPYLYRYYISYVQAIIVKKNTGFIMNNLYFLSYSFSSIYQYSTMPIKVAKY